MVKIGLANFKSEDLAFCEFPLLKEMGQNTDENHKNKEIDKLFHAFYDDQQSHKILSLNANFKATAANVSY